MFAIVWDNGHATGTFPKRYDDYGEAVEVAEEWLRNMLSIDENLTTALSCYSYDIVEACEE